jgi:pimeloyl-ACP methyl ester carboxylesterase/DNA-binding CsgD family transcriptional regulator
MTHLELDWASPTWSPWLAELTREHRLVRHDLRGCGLSDREPVELGIDAWVADLEAVVEAAGLERFVLFGICQGAGIAAAFAARHPERVRRLVLYGSYLRGALAIDMNSAAAREAKILGELIASGWGRGTPAFRELFARLLMPDAPDSSSRVFAEMERESASPEMARRLWLAFHTLNIDEEVARIRAPTLVAHATGDAVVPFEHGRRMAARIEGAQFVRLESPNHILQPHEPAWPRLWGEVHRFLAREADDAWSEDGSVVGLTSREREVLDLLARGLDNRGIAERLGIASKTVRNHVTHLFSKLGVRRRAEAVVRAREAGFGADDPGPGSRGFPGRAD